jgi:hypothetical protein
MTIATTSAADLTTTAAHSADEPNKHGLILGLIFLGWVAVVAIAGVIFGLGGVITAATITSWCVLALIMVMTAGG